MSRHLRALLREMARHYYGSCNESAEREEGQHQDLFLRIPTKSAVDSEQGDRLYRQKPAGHSGDAGHVAGRVLVSAFASGQLTARRPQVFDAWRRLSPLSVSRWATLCKIGEDANETLELIPPGVSSEFAPLLSERLDLFWLFLANEPIANSLRLGAAVIDSPP